MTIKSRKTWERPVRLWIDSYDTTYSENWLKDAEHGTISVHNTISQQAGRRMNHKIVIYDDPFKYEISNSSSSRLRAAGEGSF